MEEVAMTVDTYDPNRDTRLADVLIISEHGNMQSTAFGLSTAMNVSYFQRQVGDIPRIFPEDGPIRQVDSWRPYVSGADVVIVDDPSYVAHIGKDFDLEGTTLLYFVNHTSKDEVKRLVHWLNPMTLDSLRSAMECVDIPEDEPAATLPETEERPGFWKRLLRRHRG
jgi:hypothetical protein